MSSQLPEIAQALLNPQIYPDPTVKVDLMQTQMSFVFLTGKYVYKVKKPVNLGYLDYTTLEKRRYFCFQEVDLNRRLCPEVYLGVTPITRSPKGIALGGQGEIIDYAVKMLYLPQNRMLNILLERNRVTAEMVSKVARKLAHFHTEAATSDTISAFGSIEAIQVNTDENFFQTEKYINKTITEKQYRRIQDYTSTILRDKAAIFDQRVAGGRIRDGHGDLHSQHICFMDGICIYDCIEFVDRFRYGDVAVDLAFLAMDLDHYGRADLSRSFVNAYMEASHDSQINELLKFYKCYRAFVRGKVSSFKVDDPYISEIEKSLTLEAARSYFDLAYSYSLPRPQLFITVGLIGSGKTTLAYSLARRMGLTVISSDIVRKHLANIPVTRHRFEAMDAGIYSTEFSRQTYDKMFADARSILSQGDSVILDASFIKSEERLKAQELARETGSDFSVLECVLDEANIRKRLDQRLKNRAVSDGRWELYEPQKKKAEPVNEIPADRLFVIDSAGSLSEQIRQVIQKI
jgi:aminoglycoside phosphotransferase family enzyme/predicted kinase